MYSSGCFLCGETAPCDVSDELRLAADGLTVPRPCPSLSPRLAVPGQRVWNVGRVAAEVEVTSSRSFLFIFLFPEFRCYYSNSRWLKLSPLCVFFIFFLYPGTVTVTTLNKMLILEICADQTQIVATCHCAYMYFLFFIFYLVSPIGVFLPVYLDLISMMPTEPPGNNWLSVCSKLIALSLARRDQYWY